MKNIVLSFLLTAVFAFNPCLGADPKPGSAFFLEPTKTGAWWHFGDTVKYRANLKELPEGLTAVEGVVTNIEGDEIARVSASREELQSQGWNWKPAALGYYEVTFSWTTPSGSKSVIGRSFELKAHATGASRTFEREKQGFAVMPEAPKVEKTVGQFGFTYSNGADEIQLAKMIGFDLARLLMDWGSDFSNPKGGIESVQGTYDWSRPDSRLNLLISNHFLVNAQINYTPLWASPHPEKTNVNICVVEANTYAPVHMEDFGKFVTATVERYKDRIHMWEIWNEPSIPGGSCYWSDTPENFAKLLETGYKAIKAVQPEGEVWLGGLGPRAPYHTFYNRLLQLGCGKYFDVLSLHGAFNSPADRFREIEAANGVAPKPANAGEWHAVLQGNMQSEPILTESALSLKMMKDLLYQLKNGVSRIMMFELQNLTEKEALPFAIENKWFTHSSGLFRRRPQMEPRHCAVVMASFLDATGRSVTAAKEFKLSDESVAIQMSTGKGPLIAFWSETTPVDVKSLKRFATNNSVLRDWEGKTVALDEASKLEIKKLYYLSSPRAKALAKAESADKLISPRRQARLGQKTALGVYTKGKLFASVQDTANVPENAWITTDWKLTKLIASAHDPKFSARAAFGAHDDGLDVVVEVQDETHFQKEPQPKWWFGDSLQIAFDCEGSGLMGGNTEIVTALTDNGSLAWKLMAADPRGDIPSKWTPANALVKYGEQRIFREGTVTHYQMRIPWSELYPLSFDLSKPLRVSLAVNNNNGTGRSEFLEWGKGITQDKDPSQYGILKISAPK